MCILGGMNTQINHLTMRVELTQFTDASGVEVYLVFENSDRKTGIQSYADEGMQFTLTLKESEDAAV